VAQGAKAITGGEGSPRDEGSARPAWLESLRESVRNLFEGPQRSKKFLHEVRQEMGHVTWPPVSEVQGTTLIVIVTIFFFGVFFFVVDMGVSKVVELILHHGK